MTPVYYHCYTKEVYRSALYVSCDADYYLAGVHGGIIGDASGSFMCCKFVPTGMVDMNSFLVISFSTVMQSVCPRLHLIGLKKKGLEKRGHTL